MVQRTESNKKLDDFEGKVVSVELEEGIDQRKQYHITIDPIGFKVGGATGKLHEWIGLSPRATQEQVPQGSVMDRYLQQIEICLGKPARDAATVDVALKMLAGKKFKFSRIKLGKDFDGKSAREYIVPVSQVAN